MNILNLSHMISYPIEAGYQSRVMYYALALSSHNNIKVKQFCFNPFIFTKKKELSFNDGSYKIYFMHSFLYTIAIFIIYPIMKIRNWLHVVPIIFKIIKPSRTLRKAFNWTDIIQVEGPWLVPWVKKYTDKPVIMIAHNVEYNLASSIMEHKCKNHPQIIKKFLLNNLFNTEKYAVMNSDKVFAVSNIDKNHMLELYKIDEEKIEIVPNGINSSIYNKKNKSFLEIINQKKYDAIILFTGSAHPPNIIAADFIINNIAPLFIKENVLFLIVGRVSLKKIFKDNVLCTGPIENDMLVEYIKISDIAINPIPYGSGSNIKMFEYIAAGLPIISTLNGVEGVCSEAKKDIIICRQDQFFQKISELLKNKNKLKILSQKMKKNAKFHDYKYITKQALGFYQKLLILS